MKRLKKIFSIAVSVMFLANSVGFALAPEARLAPMNTPEFLDIAKLTAEIIWQAKENEGNILKVTRNQEHKIKIDNIEGIRDGDVITYFYREKRVLRNGEIVADNVETEKFEKGSVIFIPCSIKGKPFGDSMPKERWYICRIRENQENKEGAYDYEFIDGRDITLDARFLSKDNVNALLDDVRGLEILAKKERNPEESRAIARFVEQQNETDRVIKAVIAEEKAEKLDETDYVVNEVKVFVSSLENHVLWENVRRIITLGQIMVVPGLKKHHAGGVGIYLTEGYCSEDIVRKIFAKCGFTEEENETMKSIFNKWRRHDVATLMTNNFSFENINLTKSEELLLGRAKTTSFANRWQDYKTIDHCHDPKGKENVEIDNTDIDVAAREIIDGVNQSGGPILFVPQDVFESKQRCGVLAKEFAGAEFVLFNQHSGMSVLRDILSRDEYRGRRKVVVTMALKFEGEVKNIVKGDSALFQEVVPINFGNEGLDSLNPDEKQFLQKEIFSIALLVGTLPKEGYKETREFMVLSALLGTVLEENSDIDRYISNLVDTKIDVITRFQYIINTLLNPIVPFRVEELRYIVETLIAA
ncbi:MAG: hypothetical protein ABH844_05360 [Candidatus Omnitrophota bacterium]